MYKNEMIYNELRELNSPLAAISNSNVFTVPDGYFDSLASDILDGIRNEYSLLNLNLPALDMKVPDRYFEGLPGIIMQKIKSHEAGETSGLLAAIGKQNVFTAPEGYFEGFAANLLGKLHEEPVKVVIMKQRSIFKYAVAAAITGILGLSIFSTLDKKTDTVVLTDSKSTFAFIERGNEILKNNSFDKVMESLNDDEIINYLKTDGEDVNAALVASLTDEKTLPSEDAYFLDDKTLDNFLSEQHIDQSSNN